MRQADRVARQFLAACGTETGMSVRGEGFSCGFSESTDGKTAAVTVTNTQ